MQPKIEKEMSGENMTSRKDFFNFDEMGLCSCGEDKATYFCKKKECPNNQKQPYYCLICSEKPDMHDHTNVRIVSEIKLQSDKWDLVKKDISSLST